jgi:hypothetical protein
MNGLDAYDFRPHGESSLTLLETPEELAAYQTANPNLRGHFMRVPQYPPGRTKADAKVIGILHEGEDAADTLRRVIALAKKMAQGEYNGQHFFLATE